MKNRSNRSMVSVVLAAGLVSAGSAAAADMDSGAGGNAGSFYVNGDAGVAVLQNIIFKDFGNVIQFDVGPKVDLSVGYNVTQNIAVELQSGFAHNSWSKIDGRPLSTFEVSSGDVWSIPVMANGIYKYSFNDHWQAYGGLGAGVLISPMSFDEPGADFSATDCEFAYQAMFGVKYLVNDHLSVGLGYNFLGSLDHHWTDSSFGTSLTTSPTYLHSILLSLSCKF